MLTPKPTASQCCEAHFYWLALGHDALSSPSPHAFSLSQHQGLFQWVDSLHQVGGQSIGASASSSVLPMNSQGWFPLGWTGLMSLLSKGLSRVFSSTTIWMHRLFGSQFSFYFFNSINEKPKKKKLIKKSSFFVSRLVWDWVCMSCKSCTIMKNNPLGQICTKFWKAEIFFLWLCWYVKDTN